MTYDRKPKDAYLLAKAMFSENKVAAFGYPSRNEWVYVAQHEHDTVARINMYAYSNLAALDLYVNGKHESTQDVVQGKATWHLDLPEGNHMLSLHDSLDVPPKRIAVKIIPHKLVDDNLDLTVSLGSNYSFIDERTGLEWVQEKEYTPGSWGFVGGEVLYVANKIGTKEDILSVDFEDGLYQTMRVDIDGFRADVPDGVYEVELLMVDYVRKSRRFVNDKEVNFKPGERVFGVLINEIPLLENIDLGGEYGQNVPVRLSTRFTVSDNKGLHIAFDAIKGKPVLSGIRIKRVGY